MSIAKNLPMKTPKVVKITYVLFPLVEKKHAIFYVTVIKILIERLSIFLLSLLNVTDTVRTYEPKFTFKL